MNTFLSKIILLCSAFFLPIIPAMIAVGLLIILDTITGVMASQKRGEKICSKKFGRVITKMLVYQLLIIASQLVEKYLFDFGIIKVTLAFLGLTEMLSISENFQTITGANFIQYIRGFLDTKFRGLVGEEKKEENKFPSV